MGGAAQARPVEAGAATGSEHEDARVHALREEGAEEEKGLVGDLNLGW